MNASFERRRSGACVCILAWISVHMGSVSVLIYPDEKAPVSVMPQSFTVRRLFPANFHPQASEEFWFCSVTKWEAALIYTPGSLLRIIICILSVTPKVTLITSAQEVTFLPLFTCLLFVSKTTQKVLNGFSWNFQGHYLLLCNITGRWFVFCFLLCNWISSGSQSPFLKAGSLTLSPVLTEESKGNGYERKAL